MSTIYEYRVYCNVEHCCFTTWGPDVPIHCPNNSAHTIDYVQTVVLDSVSNDTSIVSLDYPVTIDGRISVASSSRPVGTVTHETGCSDSISDMMDIGNGALIKLIHNIGGGTEYCDSRGDFLVENMRISFNTLFNPSYIESCEIIHQNVNGFANCWAIPRLSEYSVGTNTNFMAVPFNGVPNALVLPCAGTGNIVITKPVLIETSYTQSGRGQGFWSADYDSVTKSFVNLVPNSYGTGNFNMFINRVNFDKFVNFKQLNSVGGFASTIVRSSSISRITHGIDLLIELIIPKSTDIACSASINVLMYRTKTC